MLKIQLEEIERRIVLHLEGRVDVGTAPQLEKKLEGLMAENPVLILDFDKVDYLSSAGMRVLLSGSKKLKAKKGALLLCALGEEVLEVIRMAGLDKVLPIFDTEAEAVRSTL